MVKLILLLSTALLLSSCTGPITQNNINPLPTAAISQPPTDDQLIQDLSSDPDFKIDSALNSLSSDLK